MAADMFLKIDGIDGESHDKTHTNEIEIVSFSWGANQQGGSAYGSGMGAGKVQMHDFSFNKRVDKASTALFQTCATGKHIPSAVLVCRKAAGDTQVEYLKVTFSDLIVSSVQFSGSHGDLPMESVTINFSKINQVYKEQKADGTAGATAQMTWDLKQNAAA